MAHPAQLIALDPHRQRQQQSNHAKTASADFQNGVNFQVLSPLNKSPTPSFEAFPLQRKTQLNLVGSPRSPYAAYNNTQTREREDDIVAVSSPSTHLVRSARQNDAAKLPTGYVSASPSNVTQQKVGGVAKDQIRFTYKSANSAHLNTVATQQQPNPVGYSLGQSYSGGLGIGMAQQPIADRNAADSAALWTRKVSVSGMGQIRDQSALSSGKPVLMQTPQPNQEKPTVTTAWAMSGLNDEQNCSSQLDARGTDLGSLKLELKSHPFASTDPTAPPRESVSPPQIASRRASDELIPSEQLFTGQNSSLEQEGHVITFPSKKSGHMKGSKPLKKLKLKKPGKLHQSGSTKKAFEQQRLFQQQILQRVYTVQISGGQTESTPLIVQERKTPVPLVNNSNFQSSDLNEGDRLAGPSTQIQEKGSPLRASQQKASNGAYQSTPTAANLKTSEYQDQQTAMLHSQINSRTGVTYQYAQQSQSQRRRTSQNATSSSAQQKGTGNKARHVKKQSANSQVRQPSSGSNQNQARGSFNLHKAPSLQPYTQKQPQPSQHRPFNLIVTQNGGEASLQTPIRYQIQGQATGSVQNKRTVSTQGGGALHGRSNQHSVLSGSAGNSFVHHKSAIKQHQVQQERLDNQKRGVQQSAPRLFSYKQAAASQSITVGGHGHDAKSPFLQPIVSQKHLQPTVAVTMGQGGDISLLKQQQVGAPHGKLSTIPEPLPKFVTSSATVSGATPQLQAKFKNHTQPIPGSTTANGSNLLDAFIKQQTHINNQDAAAGVKVLHHPQNATSNFSAAMAAVAQSHFQSQPGVNNTHIVSYLMQLAQSQQQQPQQQVANQMPQKGPSTSKNQTKRLQSTDSFAQGAGGVSHSQVTNAVALQRSQSSSHALLTQSIGIARQQQPGGGKVQNLQIAGSGAPTHIVSTGGNQPNLVVLGSSPSNQRLPQPNGLQLGAQLRDLRLNSVGKQVIMAPSSQATSQQQQDQARNHQIVGVSTTGYFKAQPQHAPLYSYFGPTGSHQNSVDMSGNLAYPGSSGRLNGPMIMMDEFDDGGIDERFDGDDDSGVDDAHEYLIGEEHTSPKAAKPRPLDQTFVPEKGKKYFSVTIGYPAMRRALRARGWIEVKCYKRLHQIAGYTSSPGPGKGGSSASMPIGLESTMNRQFDANIDLKFVLSAQDANHQNLKKGCLINQNRGEGHLTCKSGLKESLVRSYVHMGCWLPMEHCDSKGIGPDSFFPRSHTINSSEALQEFQRDFVLTEAENYLRKFIKKLKDFKEKGPKQQKQRSTSINSGAAGRVLTPGGVKRSPSKNRQTLKKKLTSSVESSPLKDKVLAQPEVDEETSADLQGPPTAPLAAKAYNIVDLGFLKEKLLICCNIVRKRLKCVEDKLDKKKGIRTDRHTAGTILVEERSFMLRSAKNLSQAYLKYIHKEEWYCKAVARFPQFKKDKSLTGQPQQTALCDKVGQTSADLIEQLREKYPQTDLNGYSNLWIVKPGGLSRGRKIRLFKDFQKILEYAEVDPSQQISAANGLPSSTNQGGGGQSGTQYYMNHQKPAEEVHAYTKKKWVIQKYIENPMLILNRKCDIRVWVVIPTWNPLRIYIYKECYLRFSCNDYDPRVPQNLFSHLTNNSVVKKCLDRPDNHKSLNKIPGNMWSLDQFKEHLGAKHLKATASNAESPEPQRPKTAASPEKQSETGKLGQQDETEDRQAPRTPASTKGAPPTAQAQPDEDQQDPKSQADGETLSQGEDAHAVGSKIWEEKYYPQCKEIIVQSILSAWDKIEWRKGGVGLYGFDLFPDTNGKLWLLEINKCPTMEYSTAVTRKLVPRFLEDLTELIIDKRKGNHPEVAGFDRAFAVPKLRDLSDFQSTQKNLQVEGKGIDSINNQNYLSALHRNKRKANPPAHNGHYKHNY